MPYGFRNTRTRAARSRARVRFAARRVHRVRARARARARTMSRYGSRVREPNLDLNERVSYAEHPYHTLSARLHEGTISLPHYMRLRNNPGPVLNLARRYHRPMYSRGLNYNRPYVQSNDFGADVDRYRHNSAIARRTFNNPSTHSYGSAENNPFF